MRHIRVARLGFIPVLTVLLLWATPTHTQVVCPENHVTANGITLTSHHARLEIQACDFYSCAIASFDLISRGLQSSAGAALERGASAEAAVLAECTVEGVAPGTVLTFQALLHVVGNAFGSGQFSNGGSLGLIREDETTNEQSASVGSISGSVTLDRILPIPLVKPAGAPFRLFLRTASSTIGASSGIRGDLTFADLPPGASVSICLEDSTGGVVPAATSSWGRLKLRYR